MTIYPRETTYIISKECQRKFKGKISFFPKISKTIRVILKFYTFKDRNAHFLEQYIIMAFIFLPTLTLCIFETNLFRT